MDINQFLQLAIDKQASDLHIIPNYFIAIRIHDELYQLKNYPIVSNNDSQQMLFSILSDQEKEYLLANKEVDVGYEHNNWRFRVNIYYCRGNLAASFRLIPNKIGNFDDLLLPKELARCAKFNQGLVLLTGPTGEGKSTTLAAIINDINLNTSKHIITVEDPIEYIYPQEKSIISQRQLHNDTHSWNVALRSALREDPDVILIGEMRDYETIELALTAAETGHLVLSTLHTISCPDAIDRIIDVFPSGQQNQIKTQLASVLRAVVAQRLIPRLDVPGRIPAVEILFNTQSVSPLIREGKAHLLSNVIETSEEEGFILFEKYLLRLYKEGKISRDTAFAYAIRPKELENFIK